MPEPNAGLIERMYEQCLHRPEADNDCVKPPDSGVFRGAEMRFDPNRLDEVRQDVSDMVDHLDASLFSMEGGTIERAHWTRDGKRWVSPSNRCAVIRLLAMAYCLDKVILADDPTRVILS
jgi:hypothetical protein